MRKARHIEISTRLEATKKFGLVEDYRIEWRPNTLAAPSITVCGRASCPDIVTKNYIATLLHQLVPARAIVVTQIDRIS